MFNHLPDGNITRKLVFDWADDEIRKDYENRSKILKIDAQDTVGNRLDHLIAEGVVAEEELDAAMTNEPPPTGIMKGVPKGGSLSQHLAGGKGMGGKKGPGGASVGSNTPDGGGVPPGVPGGPVIPGAGAARSREASGKGGGKTLEQFQAYLDGYDAEKEAAVAANGGVMLPPARQPSVVKAPVDLEEEGDEDNMPRPAPPAKIGRIQLNKPSHFGAGGGAAVDGSAPPVIGVGENVIVINIRGM